MYSVTDLGRNLRPLDSRGGRLPLLRALALGVLRRWGRSAAGCGGLVTGDRRRIEHFLLGILGSEFPCLIVQCET